MEMQLASNVELNIENSGHTEERSFPARFYYLICPVSVKRYVSPETRQLYLYLYSSSNKERHTVVRNDAKLYNFTKIKRFTIYQTQNPARY